MLGECTSSTIALSCSVTLRGFTASVDSPMTAILKVLKCDESQRTRDIRIDPKTTSYPLNESFDFALDTGFDERTGMLCEEKIRIEAISSQEQDKKEPISFVEFDISSYMNVKRRSTGQFTENFDIRDARLSLENGSCLLLDLNVNIMPRKQLPLKEMEYLRPQEDDLFHTVRIPSRPTTPQDKSFVSNDSKVDASFQSNAESLEEIEVVDEEGLENMSKRELIFRVKELKKQNEDLRMTLLKTTALKVQANRIESMENLIIVLKNDMATMLNAIQRSGNHELFDEIKDKVSFFS